LLLFGDETRFLGDVVERRRLVDDVFCFASALASQHSAPSARAL